MNRVFTQVWDHVHHCWKVVGEHARRRGKKTSLTFPHKRGACHLRLPALAGMALVSSIAPLAAFAADPGAQAMSMAPPPSQLLGGVLPTDANITHGSADISVNGNDMNIHQHSDHMIANWQDFSIGENNSVTFYQPGSESVALNRVLGQNPSDILGNLNANGQVFLLNPNGVMIGKNASVQTGAFVASTLGLSDEDFLSGHYQFTGDNNTDNNSAIFNQGNLHGVVVALIAPSVINDASGSITGDTALAAGTDVLLDFDGDGLLSVEVNASTLATLVDNRGLIQADGGLAVLTAKGASDALRGVVNNSGTVRAQTLENQNGRILLLGDMQHGEVNVAGTLGASAPEGGDGGFIDTSAARVTVAPDVQVTTHAENGQTGTWLIDPTDFTISAGAAAQTDNGIGADTLTGNLASTNVSIATVVGADLEPGDIHVNADLSWASSNTLSLTAHNDIHINQNISAANGGLTLNAGNALTATGAINVGTFDLQSGNWVQNSAILPAFTTADFRINPTNATFLWVLGGDGSSATPYQISDIYGLQGMASHSLLGNDFVLANDIDASGTANWHAGAGFDPIGTDYSNSFTGSLDGQGQVISGLIINRGGENGVGLFGRTDGATLTGIGLEGGNVTGHDVVGGLVGSNISSTINQSYATGSVTGRYSVGGLVGYNDNSTVSQSYATGSVTGNTEVGGLVGANFFFGTVSNSFFATTDEDGDVINNSGATTDAYTGNANGTAQTLAELQQLTTFASLWNGDIDDEGGTGAVWRIYEGQTTPLLRTFLTELEILPEFDGTSATLNNIAALTGYDASDPDILGSLGVSSTLLLSSDSAGVYTASIDGPVGLYSHQQGYDLILGNRNIATAGTDAGDIDLQNSNLTWTQGTLRIDTSGDILNIGAINGGADSGFDLARGNWQQNSASLPAFAVNDFRLDPANATFLRVVGGMA